MKHKITFKKPIALFWSDLTDLDGYTFDNEMMYFPKTAWKKKADYLIVEIKKDENGDILIRDFERTALFPELYEACMVEEVV